MHPGCTLSSSAVCRGTRLHLHVVCCTAAGAWGDLKRGLRAQPAGYQEVGGSRLLPAGTNAAQGVAQVSSCWGLSSVHDVLLAAELRCCLLLHPGCQQLLVHKGGHRCGWVAGLFGPAAQAMLHHSRLHHVDADLPRALPVHKWAIIQNSSSGGRAAGT